ncbi:MAG: serine/threonine-protein kinase [Pseudomonadota bacterium]
MVSTSPPDLSALFEEDGPTPVVPSLDSVASAPTAHEPLESLERYKLVGRLGQGGMAEVFLAAWEVAPFVHRPVVIKRLHTHFSDDQRLVQMFLDEARLLCLLEHPHVVKTLEAGVIDGRCCIAMEYLEGQPLHRVLRRAAERGQLPIETAVTIAISVLAGLDYAHNASDAQGQTLELVHRDISPQNVFVGNDGQVKVLDFGIAKAKSHQGRTATGIVKGKVGYIAPEQAAGELVDRRADIWSTGVVLWEALTGSRLFKGETDAATLSQSLKGEIPRASARRPNLPVQLDAVLTRALQRSPALRYPSARAMQQDLEAWLKGAGHAPSSETTSGLMGELFGSEIGEQRRMVSVLMARSDCTAPAPISNRAPNSTSALIVNRTQATSSELSSVNERMNDLGRRRRRALSVGAALLALATCAWAVVFFVMPQLKRGAPSASPASVSAAAPGLPKTAIPSAPSATSAIEPNPLPPTRKLKTSPPARPTTRAALTPRAIPVHAALPLPPTSEKPETPASFGFLTVDTSPWSMVSVAGKPLGQTPLVSIKLPTGAHVLLFRNPELGIETSFNVTIEPGKTAVRRVGIE